MMMTVILLLLGLVVFDVLAMRFGVDSRDGFGERSPPRSTRRGGFTH